LPSSVIIGRRFFADRPRWLALLVVAGTVGCSRNTEKSESSAARAESTAMQGASATAPSVANDNAPPGVNQGSANEAPGTAPSAAAGDESRTVSAERVLAEVRRLGGKGTLVNAWASWCGPCQHELPMLARLAAELAPRGVHVLLVSLDEPGDHDKATAFLQQRGIELPSYFAERPLGPFKRGMNPRWPGMLPASFLFDASGRLRYFWGGEAFEEELTPVLDALVAGKPIEGEANAQVAPEGEAH
jgi:thiol-disulfide isomerase/thioredoxin